MAKTAMNDILALGLRFLGSRDDAWISVKQVNWLLGLISKATRENWPRNRGFIACPDTDDDDGWELKPCAPNGAAIIHRIKAVTPLEKRRNEFNKLAEELMRPMWDAEESGNMETFRAIQIRYRALCQEYADVTKTATHPA